MSVEDMVRIPQFDRRVPFTETIDRHINEGDRRVGSLQQGPRPGEDIPEKFRPDISYTGVGAPGTGPLNRRGG